MRDTCGTWEASLRSPVRFARTSSGLRSASEHADNHQVPSIYPWLRSQRQSKSVQKCSTYSVHVKPRLARNYHHLSGEKCPAACSSTRPSENKVSSSNGRPISCSPSGSPLRSSPAGTEMPGRPAMFTVTVNTSFKYISTGSTEDFSPTPNAADGAVGVNIAWSPDWKWVSQSP